MQHRDFLVTPDGLLEDRPDAARAGSTWIVDQLPHDPRDRERAQAAALARADLHLPDGTTHASLAAVVLDPRHAGPLPDDPVVLRVPLHRTSDDPHPAYVPVVHLVVQPDRVVTTSTDGSSLDRLVERVRAMPHSGRRGALVVVRALLSLAMEDATAGADRITAHTSALEDGVFAEPGDAPVRDVAGAVYRLKRSIAEVRRSLLPLINKLELVTDSGEPTLGSEAVTQLDRIESGLRRVADALDTDDRLLGDMLSAHLTTVQVQQNSDMRRISAYAALLAVPTLVARIYGMNFQRMPELSWTFGYPIALGVMVALVLLLRWAFKRSGWL